MENEGLGRYFAATARPTMFQSSYTDTIFQDLILIKERHVLNQFMVKSSSSGSTALHLCVHCEDLGKYNDIK